MKSCMGGGVRGRGVYAFVLIAGAGKGWAGVTTQPYSPLYTPPLPLRHPPLSKPNLIHHQPPLSPPQLPSPSIYATYPFPSFSIPLCIIYICQKLSNYTPSLSPPQLPSPPIYATSAAHAYCQSVISDCAASSSCPDALAFTLLKILKLADAYGPDVMRETRGMVRD